jgi:rhodanese-related sulfurtransferase
MESSDSAILIDVREYFEYKKSRIDHAVNIPSSGDIDRSADTLSRQSPLFLYCTTGFRSKRVAKQLAARGFENVSSLDGGIKAWKKEGFPVDKKRPKKGK